LTKFLNSHPDWYPPEKKWGGVLWAMVAFHLNQRTDEANQILLDLVNEYLPRYEDGKIKEVWFKPEASKDLPFNFFAVPEYVRILYMYGSQSEHSRGRLKPEVEAAMKEFMWFIVSEKSKISETGPERLLVYHGPENHDLLRRVYFYLMNYLYMEDPDYRDRKYKDGFTAKDHYEAYNRYFLARPGMRAMAGEWAEAGSDSYKKYAAPTQLNLAELAPDPRVRELYKMVLDLAFIEEAQVSVQGRRGGGRSRAYYGRSPWETTLYMLLGLTKGNAGSTHNKIFDVSSYQMPAAAIVLHKLEFPAAEPFEIINRTLGELDEVEYERDEDTRQAYVLDGSLVNYAYRTPHYLMGGHLQNPALSMDSFTSDHKQLKYSGISAQLRWSGLFFDHPDTRAPNLGNLNSRNPDEMCAIYPEIEKTGKGRPSHSFWGIQKKGVMLLQRIPNRPQRMGSYNTGRISIRLHGKRLGKTEEDGWIFASDGKAFAAVRFLDGDYEWDSKGELATPKTHDRDSTSRYLIHAGDIGSYKDFGDFKSKIKGNDLVIDDDKISYVAESDGVSLTMFVYTPERHQDFRMPLIDGKAPDLNPEWTFNSPYVNSAFEEKTVKVTVGPIQELYDFGG
jgi:hypothetical protein